MNRRFRIVAALGVVGAFVACAVDPLNPQPLPPSNEFGGESDASAYRPADSGTLATDPSGDKGSDAASVPPEAPSDGGDAGDVGDAGDGGDASDAAHHDGSI